MEDSSSEEYLSADEGIGENGERSGSSSKSAETTAPPDSAAALAREEGDSSPVMNGLSVSSADQIPPPGTEKHPVLETPPPSVVETTRSLGAKENLPTGPEETPPPGPVETLSPGIEDTPPPGQEETPPPGPEETPPPSSEETPPPPEASPVELPALDDPPVPPPRRKRKKNREKQPSLENLTEIEDHSERLCRSLTVGSSDPAKELSRQAVKTLGQPSCDQHQEDMPSSTHEQPSSSPEGTSVASEKAHKETSPSSSHEDETPSCSPKEATPTAMDAVVHVVTTPPECLQATEVETKGAFSAVECDVQLDKEPVSRDQNPADPSTSGGSSEAQMDKEGKGAGTEIGWLKSSSSEYLSSSSSLVREHVSRSRSATPTPAISIEPDHGLEWTADMLSLPESEVVTSETSLAKARGSNTTASSKVVYASDDDSVDGGDTPDEGGEGDSEGGADNDPTPDSAKESEPAPTPSVPPETDNAILESTMVTNLDTGEVIPLSAAEEKIPQGHGWSPLSEHLLRRTKEIAEAQGQAGYSFEDEYAPHAQRRKTRKKAFINLKKWGRKRDRMGGYEGAGQSEEAALNTEDKNAVKYKQASHKQHKQEFDKVRLKQDLTGTHLGAIWSMEFSICGRLLATAGQDSVVRVWVLATAAVFFHELQAQYQRMGVHSSVDSLSEKASVASSSSKSSEEDENSGGKLPFQEHPLCSYYGHTADVLDLSWSKNFFLLSSSMDKTVRLWHISRKECLCVFQHVDFVTAIAFHPRDDRYFLSGSLDGKLRLWNIPDKKVALWNEIEGVGSHLITAANFCMNGKLAVVGTYDGRCMFYDTEHLKYHTQIHVKSRHGKNKGRKISGVEPLPGEDKLLVTSNDSRIRLYNLKDHELSCKYKGCLNTSSQIKATFSRDGQYIISGSEDNFIYLWKTHLDVNKLSSARRDRNEFYESFSSHTAPVTTAVFAPVPGITVDEGIKEVGEIVVAADYQGSIKIYVSGEKL